MKTKLLLSAAFLLTLVGCNTETSANGSIKLNTPYILESILSKTQYTDQDFTLDRDGAYLFDVKMFYHLIFTSKTKGYLESRNLQVDSFNDVYRLEETIEKQEFNYSFMNDDSKLIITYYNSISTYKEDGQLIESSTSEKISCSSYDVADGFLISTYSDDAFFTKSYIKSIGKESYLPYYYR